MSLAGNVTPITGHENVGELDERVGALFGFYRAFNSRDINLIAENWDQSEKASMDNPLGGLKRGWPDIRAGYERVFRSSGTVQVEFYDYSMTSATGFIRLVANAER